MPKACTQLIEQFARTHERDVKRTLQRHYGAKLSSEDISDVLQDTYLAASAAVAAPEGPSDLPALRMWFYGAARHKAIDAIRSVEGRRYTRDRDVSYDALTEDGAVADPLEDDEHAESLERVDAPVKAQDVALVNDAFGRLSSQHRELLRLTDMDEDPRSLRDAAALMGKSKSELARQRSRALAQLSVLVSRPRGADCVKARSLTAAPGRHTLAWRDAHLADCLRCQVSYGKRVQVLLPFLPLAVPGRIARLSNALGSALGRGDVPAEAAAAGIGVASATGSGIGGAGLVGGGGTTVKVAACAAALTCVAFAAPQLPAGQDGEGPSRAVRAAVATTRSVAAEVVPSVSPAAPSAPPAVGPESWAPATTPAPRRERGPRRARARDPKPSTPHEFAPESFTPPSTSPTPVIPALAQEGAATAPVSVPPASPSSGFSQEFAP